MKILVVDDEKDILDLVSVNLEREGFKVITADNGEDALDLVKSKKPDLVVLDLMLPGIHGLEVCRQIRGAPEHAGLPILILSAKGTEVDRIVGLEMGADDYITKPFSVGELVARIRAALRKTGGNQQKKLTQQGQTFFHKDLFVDFQRYEVTIGGKKTDLPPIETKLLFFFTKNPGRVYTRDQLLDHVWGDKVFVTPRVVDVHISHLRKIIEKDPQKPAYIVTVTNVGYKFDDSTA
ncbi:MAG TPA: response regulator transcription factor [Syntrophorhabdaceae bacterium]|nr:response regulator transcription factor [Syntrophorhabdaceae bacterium]